MNKKIFEFFYLDPQKSILLVFLSERKKENNKKGKIEIYQIYDPIIVS